MQQYLKIVFASLFATINIQGVHGQCPSINIAVEDSVCRNAPIVINNNTTGGVRFEWDFCIGELLDTPSGTSIGSIAGSNDPRSIEIKEFNDNWYGFVPSKNNFLYRVDFGTSLDNNAPIITNLGIIAGLNRPEDIVVVREGGNWHGLVHNTGDQSIVRLDFGSDLTNTPTATQVVTSVGGNFTSIALGNDDNEWVLLVSNFSGNTVNIIRFGNSITNVPATGDILTSAALPGSSGLIDIELVSECDQWFGYAVTFNNRRLIRLDFGSSLFSIPTPQPAASVSIGGDQIFAMQLALDNNEHLAFLSTRDGNFIRLNLGDQWNSSISSTDVIGDFEGLLSSTFGLNMVFDQSRWYAYPINPNAREFFRLTFPNLCNANIAFSTEVSPSNINYNISGLQRFEIKAFDNNNISDVAYDSVFVLSDPIAAFSNAILCVGEETIFSDMSVSGSDITGWAWDFDDPVSGSNNLSIEPNPSHSFTASGDYDVRLTITDDCGFSSDIIETITIFADDDMTPSFSVTGVSCTNGAIPFIDESTFVNDMIVEWHWDFDGQGISTDQNPEFTFTIADTYNVELTVIGISGCQESTVIPIIVQEGPTVSFSVDDDCVGTLMQFNNSSSGNIISQSWNFGNGFTSSLINPAFEYTEPGTYEVTLTATNDQGCVVSASEFVTVYELPQVQFTNELSCEQSPTQFIDQTVIGDANIVNWSWDFDDEVSGNNTSIARDPQHTFSGSGNFNVKLVTTTTFGCVDSVEQIVSVLPGPEVDFSFDQVCIGEPIQFQDLSIPPTGGTITSWAWDLGGVFSDEQNPQFTFDVASEYRIGLVVTSDNLCSSFLEKIITVASPPDVSFEQEFACNNEPVHFYDVTEITNDRILEWNWNFDGLGQASDSSTFFMFPSEGNYNVSLNITTENGCNYSTSQMVEVNVAPNASFESDFTFGSPPLSVQFSNTSQGANSFLWDFDNGNTSTEESPQQVFDILDEYDVRLVANSAEGCRDTARQVISVLIPELEVELERVSLIPTGTSNNVVLTISNNGTLILDSLIAAIDLGNEVIVNETIKEKIYPGETINHTLNLSIGNNRLDYICIALESFLPNITDSNLNNNNRCEGLLRDAFILPPFPNPVSNEVTLSVVSGAPQMINVQLISNQGALVRDINVAIDEGFSNILIDVTDLNNGIYILNSSVGNTSNSVRVMVNN